MELFVNYFIYFIIYSFIGWSIEVICKLIELNKFVNRGFLLGPICPIYGYGVILIIIFIGNNTSDVLAIFTKSVFICSLLEYLTSYFMEKIFKARWWDYSSKRFNINGRICLETMIPFGILGCIVIYIIHPFITNLVGMLNYNFLIIVASILFICYITDNIISSIVMIKIKKQIKNQKVDNTEYIRKKIIEWINSNSILYKHIKNAFPKFKIYIKKKK